MCESSSRASRDWPRVSDIFFLKKEAIDLRDKFRGKGKQKPVFFLLLEVTKQQKTRISNSLVVCISHTIGNVHGWCGLKCIGR